MSDAAWKHAEKVAGEINVERAEFAQYVFETEKAHEPPPRSVGYLFWWSVRYELWKYAEQWAKEPEKATRAWLGYLHYKLVDMGQLEPLPRNPSA